MNLNSLMSKIEALLFVVGDEGMTAKQLSQLLDVDLMEIEAALSELETNYSEAEERGVTLKTLAGTYQLTTKPEMADTIKKLVENPNSQVLSTASLEVLAIIAYKQPITRTEIEDLRGVKSERPIQTLVSRALVQEVGRAEGTGRAILYGTTKEFLNYFGLKDLTELPPLPEGNAVDENEESDLFMTKFQEAFNSQE
ncbi:SMC-Scp complex subunit ScpB [Ureibacillus chungkukjangi]|uniref:Segregation and condensation protein B n=1 Tax=Ureibacillus chungkukjangi TaxID=1202712 RepID=A0A318U1E5_9BACL|nr:SMC-Scp complex subunit ScpB [Ureibacillus chungkukjangi]MCM3388979.1 SMC-Scp complex subunit ScpB [Ureibacillus chungkukjangi]PYF05759.1 segregation and condensation protein B [Ureibacillus chungkukjangi]